ncbi:TlpA disulfide reductase family protein [Phocaeicola sartorii]|uniref:TlpA disulfide reductase family protein n=1 Tax=Phocaeicola sartorii TaxID=671267 RepID=UPI00248BA9A8|nr:TlpA disulfide reductase family protein [Phocaeicola sartorii]
MKRIACALLGAGLMTACQLSNKWEISGTLTGIESDTLIVKSYSPSDQDNGWVDTIPMQNGHFAFNLGDSVLKQVYIYAMPKTNPDGSVSPMKMQPVVFVLLPGQSVEITGSLYDYQLKGGKFYADFSQVLENCKYYELKMDSLRELMTKMYKKNTSKDSLHAQSKIFEQYNNAVQKIKLDYIKQNPDNDVAVYVMSSLRRGTKNDEIFNLLTDRAKTGIMAPLYQKEKMEYDKESARMKALEAMKPGNSAPDFTLKDLNGKDFSLSSLRGKYVVLDFWGSWCHWCVKDIPDMKKAYKKYKNKMEFISIDCHDSESKWKEAVKKHQIPWVNVRNSSAAGHTDVAVLYGVNGYPTKYVIDPEGKIALRILGEDPAFYTALDEFMNK